MVRFLKLTAVLFLQVSCMNQVWAWEADVHYGLVKWLAFQAGFSLTDAEIIAAGSVSADETHVLAATYLVAEVCARRDAPKIEAVSRVVQQHHFPASNAVPGAPKSRRVENGVHDQANGGNRWVRQEIAVGDKTLSPTVRLNRFGAALHPLGDSWSHAGEPDVPAVWKATCRQPQLAWSHPQARGGWRKHDADLTWKHKEDTLQTARAMFAFMLEFLDKNEDFQSDPGQDWGTLKKRLGEFQSANTQYEKFQWFIEEDQRWREDQKTGLPYDQFSTYPCFLKSLSLKKANKFRDRKKLLCAEPRTFATVAEPDPKMPLSGAPVGSIIGFTEDLLHTWFVEQQVDEIAAEMTDAPRLTAGLSAARALHSTLSADDSVEGLLAMWLVEDHGLINAEGHGVADPELLQRLSDPGLAASDGAWQRISADDLGAAISFPSSALPFAIFRNDNENASYTVLFKPANAPRDLLSLTIERAERGWKLVGLDWSVD
ncbi:MAG: hypothetical protein PVG76_06615 [Chromatiales bacterium]|jgi:hypothetical protein